MLLDILFFIISCLVLIFTAELVIQTLTKIAGYLRVSEYLIAFIVMAVATSIPELFVGISSALKHNSGIILGTIIGANLINLTIVIGIPILISGGITIKNKELKKDTFYMFIIAALPGVLMLIGNSISRLDGAILLLVFIFYSIHTIKARKGFRKVITEKLTHWQAIINTLLFAASLYGLFYASSFVVKYASSISLDAGLPPIFIGLFIISVGTTLPELIVGIRSVQHHKPSIALGDVIGSVITNSTLVLGVAALIHPIQANIFLFLTSTAFMLLAAFLFSTFTESGSKLYQKEGIALIMLYVLFLLVELNLKGFF